MFSDLRFALRQIWKHRGLTVVAVLTLGLGIGANTAIFSMIHSVLIEPLPYPQPESLVRVFETVPSGGRNAVSGGAFKDWADNSTSFEHLAISETVQANMTGSGSPERVSGLRVSTGFLPALGIAPHLGRGFADGQDRPEGDSHTIVLADGFWRSRFGADPGLLGRSVVLDKIAYSVVGILPPEALLDNDAAYLIPIVIDHDAGQWRRAGHWRSVIGRLAPGVSAAQAQTELRAIKQRLKDEYPDFKEDWSVDVVLLQEAWAGDVRPTLVLLLATVALVLLIACANVSNLLLARGTARAREMAIRGALGAHSFQIMRQMLIESLVLAAAGCAFGLMLAGYGIEALAYLMADRLPYVLRPELDLRVLLFSIVIAGGSGLVFGMLPAWRAGRQSVEQELKDSARGTSAGGRSRSQSTLVVAEVALTLVLLVVAGLFLRSFAAVLQVDPGFDPKDTLAFDLSFPAAQYPEPAARLALIEKLTQELDALPGSRFVGAASALPLSRDGRTELVSRMDREERRDYVAGCTFISGDYFPAMGMSLIRGRAIESADHREDAARVVVIDSTLAADLYPDEDPIGLELRLFDEAWKIVGLVEPVRQWVLDRDPPPAVYLPHGVAPGSTSLVMRSELPPAELAESLRSTVHAADPDLPIANVRTLEQAVDRSLAARRATLLLLGLFAAVAVGLACVGIYGVMSFTVGQRARELGIRSALGAQRRDLIRLVLAKGWRLTGSGVAMGILVAVVSARWLESRLFEVGTRDPWVYLSAALLMVAVATVSTYLPAHRASGTNPIETLRKE